MKRFPTEPKINLNLRNRTEIKIVDDENNDESSWEIKSWTPVCYSDSALLPVWDVDSFVAHCWLKSSQLCVRSLACWFVRCFGLVTSPPPYTPYCVYKSGCRCYVRESAVCSLCVLNCSMFTQFHAKNSDYQSCTHSGIACKNNDVEYVCLYIQQARRRWWRWRRRQQWQCGTQPTQNKHKHTYRA